MRCKTNYNWITYNIFKLIYKLFPFCNYKSFSYFIVSDKNEDHILILDCNFKPKKIFLYFHRQLKDTRIRCSPMDNGVILEVGNLTNSHFEAFIV
jgi:hypothetical protein